MSNHSQNSKKVGKQKSRGLPTNLASNRSHSFVSRKALGDITSKENNKKLKIQSKVAPLKPLKEKFKVQDEN